MQSPLPADILWAILEHMEDDKPGMAALCRASSSFKEIAECVLYRRIELSLPSITPVCIALATQPRLALHVRHFETSKIPGWKPRDATHLMYMRNALRRMRGLRVLRIHFSGPLAWILEGCHFSELRSMLCNLSCDHHLAAFFRRQTNLIDVTLSSIHSNHFPCFIDQACLPNLKRISADPVWLGMLVPQHPIADIDVWDFRDSLAVALGPFWAIDWLSLSLTSVITLAVSESFLATRGAIRVASFVPHLRHLKIKCNTLNIFSDDAVEERQTFTEWLSRSLCHFVSIDTAEVIVRGTVPPIIIEESLLLQFVVDVSEETLDLHNFVLTFSPKPGINTRIIWNRYHEEWFRAPTYAEITEQNT